MFLAACQRPEAPRADASQPALRIELNRSVPESPTVDVVGIPASVLSRLSPRSPASEEWTALLRVVVAGSTSSDTDRPAVLGRYTITGSTLRFTPLFPFDPGQRYDVTFDPSRLQPPAAASRKVPESWRSRRIDVSVEIPAPDRRPTTHVVDVFPSAAVVPENQLRMYIAFSAPMGLAGGTGHVRLLDAVGRPVDDPFLPLDVDLWNDDRTRYTVLFDPGRVKRGILPNEEMGRSLIVGRTYTLVVDASWRDALGQPLVASFRRQLKVGPAEERAIDPAAWRLDPPGGSTRDPLVASFPNPLDYALLQRALTVATTRGEQVLGDVRVEAGETRWLFTPRQPWLAGEYRLHASSLLEDVSGNRIGRPFEVERAGEGVGVAARSAALPFTVVSR